MLGSRKTNQLTDRQTNASKNRVQITIKKYPIFSENFLGAPVTFRKLRIHNNDFNNLGAQPGCQRQSKGRTASSRERSGNICSNSKILGSSANGFSSGTSRRTGGSDGAEYVTRFLNASTHLKKVRPSVRPSVLVRPSVCRSVHLPFFLNCGNWQIWHIWQV